MVKLENISKIYRQKDGSIHALQDVFLHVPDGGFAAIVGPSGSGKTTLMNIIGCLDMPTQGDYYLGGSKVTRMSGTKMAALRNRQIGFIFQSFNLISSMTALQNVEMPLMLRGDSRNQRRQEALNALDQVGLADRAGHLPCELSGGQQQRVAIARVLAGRPGLILADEPTGNLDENAAAEVIATIRRLNGEGCTVIMITHDKAVAAASPRIVYMDNGKLRE